MKKTVGRTICTVKKYGKSLSNSLEERRLNSSCLKKLPLPSLHADATDSFQVLCIDKQILVLIRALFPRLRNQVSELDSVERPIEREGITSTRFLWPTLSIEARIK